MIKKLRMSSADIIRLRRCVVNSGIGEIDDLRVTGIDTEEGMRYAERVYLVRPPIETGSKKKVYLEVHETSRTLPYLAAVVAIEDDKVYVKPVEDENSSKGLGYDILIMGHPINSMLSDLEKKVPTDILELYSLEKGIKQMCLEIGEPRIATAIELLEYPSSIGQLIVTRVEESNMISPYMAEISSIGNNLACVVRIGYNNVRRGEKGPQINEGWIHQLGGF